MFDIVPYWYRIALLLLLMSVVAAFDWRRKRQSATKWKEYGFVIVSGVIGALFGLLNDLVTSTIWILVDSTRLGKRHLASTSQGSE
jgi:cytochrome bd-type quinol oxidase subunit 2